MAGFAYAFWNRRTQLQEKSWDDSQERSAMQKEVEELRERIRVLERIAFDNNSLGAQERRRISAEIEALKDEEESR
nr:hypothetical protein [Parapontixanthobacter aurantiacus]